MFDIKNYSCAADIYFDGDGCISSYKVKGHIYQRISIVSGSKELIDGLINLLKVFEIKCNYLLDRKTTHVLYISRKADVSKFLEIIYNEATIYLDRKYQHSLIPC